MGIKLFITIDTEEDKWGDYTSTEGTVENINQLPLLQKIFNQYGAIPTYLINYPVATSLSSIQTLSSFLNDGTCEIGTHCHPWNTPPFIEELNRKNSMMCHLPYELLYEKMDFLHEAIKSNFGVSPITFRAGRWGFNETVARCLVEFGYKVDTSISPFVDWTPNCGPNYLNAHTQSYYFNPDNIFKPVCNDSRTIFEVPPTIGYLQKSSRLRKFLQNRLGKEPFTQLRLLGILNRLRFLNFHWLSPELSTGEEMVSLAKSFVKNGHTFLNMSFHSNSMLPGKNPFVRTEEDLKNFLNRIEVLLKYAVEQNYDFLPLADSCKHLNANKLT